MTTPVDDRRCERFMPMHVDSENDTYRPCREPIVRDESGACASCGDRRAAHKPKAERTDYGRDRFDHCSACCEPESEGDGGCDHDYVAPEVCTAPERHPYTRAPTGANQ